MTNITYTYEIISVNETARCMEVVYTSVDHGALHIGARLPFEGETLEQVIAMFAPVQEWRLREFPVVAPEVGVVGQMVDAPPVPPVVDPEVAARELRSQLLQENVDPYVMNSLRWGEMTETQQADIADYRRSLLDITDQPNFPLDIVWPQVPSCIA
tara:strand:- start:557 stop:1024 length:468 start_codon:yes stop_codon:yes gene_type:complete